MKFVCNNCGFTADIPEQMSACPMCGSSNVSSSAETSKFPTDAGELDEKSAKPQNSRAEGPTQRVTLTEGMNIGDSDPKPVEKQEKKQPCRACRICVALAVVLLVLAVAAAAVAFFFYFK